MQAQIATLQARIDELEEALTPNSILLVKDAGTVSDFAASIKSIQITNFVGEWSIELPNMESMQDMFYDCTGLTAFSVEIPYNIQNTSNAFRGCSGLTEWNVELPQFVEDASYMFAFCSGLTEWTVDLPEYIYNANAMFRGCTGLTSWDAALPLEVSMYGGLDDMFSACTSLQSF